MPRHTVAGRSTIVPTNLLPGVSLYATAAVRPKIIEFHVFNTATTAFVAALQRLSSATGVGAGLTEAAEDDPDHVALATAFAGHTSGPTITAGEVRRATLGASIGSGVMWTFGERGLQIPAGTANGIGLTCPTGTGQTFDYTIVWDE